MNPAPSLYSMFFNLKEGWGAEDYTINRNKGEGAG